MTWRLFRFFLFQLAGGVLGHLLFWGSMPAHGAIVGLLAASALWVLIDLRRGAKLLLWLKRGDASTPANVGGLWGEVANRAWRLVRAREAKAADSETRLQEFLAAIQGFLKKEGWL